MVLTDAAGQPMHRPRSRRRARRRRRHADLPEAATGKVSLDPEAIVRLPDGGFFIGDEYGPYIYRFSADGKICPPYGRPAAFIPLRHGAQNFSSEQPRPRRRRARSADPDTGRQNNQGFEGMALTPDGKKLVAVLQSATAPGRRRFRRDPPNTRALVYDGPTWPSLS